ncbi:inactive protein RESTRICTED TEV MOVEMENT 1-like [Durio zibethinus]|uniref:Inactive protein RESTRICTED TEV MOVEMENT 1-like n=1 Tax=Durio zibethinus TaxID=66656 RepID=A0A6P6A8L3_DURZI|nr:inactive protein RESTRICTED TEV MOVEMENT 1-like [Durio zibethinus]
MHPFCFGLSQEMNPSESEMIKVGPAGSRAGEPWDEKGLSEITEIYISHGDDTINSLQFQYVENRTLVLSEQHGESGGRFFNVVHLNHPSEYITGIAGNVNSYIISALTITTNITTYGPFGSQTKVAGFDFRLGNLRLFGGFYGHFLRRNDGTVSLSAIGIYVNPTSNLPTSTEDRVRGAALPLGSETSKYLGSWPAK